MEKIAAIILSGGKSQRFGQDKGLFMFREKPLIKHSIDLCNIFTNSVLITSNNPLYQQFHTKVVPDIYKNAGPMGGIYSGLVNSPCDINLIVPADTPFVQKELIEMLLRNYQNEDILITQTPDSKYQSLIGIYHSRITGLLQKELEMHHYKMIRFIKQTHHKIIKLSAHDKFLKSFINFNYQSDLEQYEH